MTRLLRTVVILLLFTSYQSLAQTYYLVNHFSGAQTIGGNVVTVSPINSGSPYGAYCGLTSNSYYFGNNNTQLGYKYQFANKVSRIKLIMGGQNAGEVISFFINGSLYSLTSANFSAYTGGCTFSGSFAAISGNLEVTPFNTYANGIVEIIYPTGIDSVRVNHNGSYSMAGTVYNFYFSSDTIVSISHPFNDTLLCAGDTILLPYVVDTKFNSANVFTAQLSNSSGSFASPVNIGTRTSDTSGIITCVIPASTVTGSGYRIRITGSSPLRTSTDNGINIGIGSAKPDKPVASNNSPVCTGNTLSFYASSTTTSGVTWKWTGSGSFNAALQNPAISNVTLANSGTYIVTASIYGCKAKDTTIAGVSSTAGVALAAGNTPVCDNDTLKLTCNGTSTALSYAWTGPNSFSSSAQNPVIVHPTSAAAGNYYLSMALPGCTILDTINIQVRPGPTGLTKSSNSPLCPGDTIRLFSAAATTGVNYLWSGPNSFATFTQNPVIPNAAPVNSGWYHISLLLNGCSVTDSVNVVINPLPALAAVTANTPLCAGNTLNLSAATTTTGVTYSWTGPNSFSSSQQNPSVSNASTNASGDYIVTATLGSCRVKDTVTALVKPLPSNTAATNNTPVCQDGTLSLAAATTSSGVSFSWTGPNGFSSTLQNPSVANAQPVASGVYTVSFDLNGCTVVGNTTAIVTANPAKPAAGSNSPVCTGTPVYLTASTVAGASSYSWNGPAGFNSSVQNPFISHATATMSGIYTVRSYNNGCYSVPDSVAVTIIPAPAINIYPNPNDTICRNSNVTFVAVTANSGTATSFRWFRNNSFTGNTNASFSSSGIADNDIIFCELTAAGVCPSIYKDTSNTIQMTVLPWLAPTVNITSNPATPLSPYQLVTFTAHANNAGNQPGYQWQRNGNDVTGATSNTWGTHQLSDNDAIRVVVTSSYMCPQPPAVTSNIINVSVLTGIDDVHGANTSTLYPNPNNGSFRISGLNPAVAQAMCTITNTLGQVVYSKHIFVHNGLSDELVISGLADGIYMLHTDTGKELLNNTFRVSRQ